MASGQNQPNPPSENPFPIDELVQRVIGAAFKVYNVLGFGFLESVYEKALCLELRKLGISFQRQAPVQVWYEGEIVGDFNADLLIEGRLIVELKSVQMFAIGHEVQLVNYLTATRIDDGLLLNFGPQKVEVKRKFRVYRSRRGQDQQN
jgi:GxxExxY protein